MVQIVGLGSEKHPDFINSGEYPLNIDEILKEISANIEIWIAEQNSIELFENFVTDLTKKISNLYKNIQLTPQIILLLIFFVVSFSSCGNEINKAYKDGKQQIENIIKNGKAVQYKYKIVNETVAYNKETDLGKIYANIFDGMNIYFMPQENLLNVKENNMNPESVEKYVNKNYILYGNGANFTKININYKNLFDKENNVILFVNLFKNGGIIDKLKDEDFFSEIKNIASQKNIEFKIDKYKDETSIFVIIDDKIIFQYIWDITSEVIDISYIKKITKIIKNDTKSFLILQKNIEQGMMPDIKLFKNISNPNIKEFLIIKYMKNLNISISDDRFKNLIKNPINFFQMLQFIQNNRTGDFEIYFYDGETKIIFGSGETLNLTDILTKIRNDDELKIKRFLDEKTGILTIYMGDKEKSGKVKILYIGSDTKYYNKFLNDNFGTRIKTNNEYGTRAIDEIPVNTDYFLKIKSIVKHSYDKYSPKD